MKKQIKLSEYAKLMGVTYRAAHMWWKSGKIEGAYKSPSGSVFVTLQDKEETTNQRVVVYCRVSNKSRKDQMQYQVDRCIDYCVANGYAVSNIYKEVASGMNDKRQQLWKMIDSDPTVIVVENKDRLTRFGFEYLERLLSKRGCKLIVLNPSSGDEDDLIKDMVSIITSFCCRLYGLRRVKNKMNKLRSAVAEVLEDK